MDGLERHFLHRKALELLLIRACQRRIRSEDPDGSDIVIHAPASPFLPHVCRSAKSHSKLCVCASNELHTLKSLDHSSRCRMNGFGFDPDMVAKCKNGLIVQRCPVDCASSLKHY
jgi:hypothetical protein